MKDLRRIQRTGESTYIISLPKKWATLNNVEAGTEASIHENQDGSLIVSVKKEQKEQVAVIHSSNNGEATLRKIIAAYIAGYEKIVIKGSNAASACEDARSKLSGLEILDEKTDEGVLGVLSKGNEFDTNEILNRMHSISTALFGLVIDAINGETQMGKEAARRETEIDRLYILALRTINHQSAKVSLAVCNALVAKILERISDHIEFLYAESPKVRKNSTALASIKELESIYLEVFESLVNLNISEETTLRIIVYQQNISRSIQKSTPALRAFLERCLRISEYVFDITEIIEDIIAIKGTSKSN